MRGKIINSLLAAMGANTIKANITSGLAAAANPTRASVRSNILYPPQFTVVTATGAGTYTTPTVNGELPISLTVRLVGAGGGGAGGGTGGGNGGSGGNTTFGTLTGNGGAGGTNNPSDGVFPAAGTASGGDINLTGQDGGSVNNTPGANSITGPAGGQSYFMGAGVLNFHTATNAAAANAAKANTGSGGSAGMTAGVVPFANGGAAGGYCKDTITPVAASYNYSVGAKGTGGSAGSGGSLGGNGADGIIIIEARWQ